MKRFCIKICSLFLFTASLIISSCGSQKKVISNSEKSIGVPVQMEIANPILENIELSMTSVLALSYKGKTSINLYENYVEVSLENGGVYLNPRFNNRSYEIKSMDVGLAKYTDKVKGNWEVFNRSPKLQLNSKIKSVRDTLGLANAKFYIYYNNPTDLKEAWITATCYNYSGATVYIHSQKIGHYFQELVDTYLEQKLVSDYSSRTVEELTIKQIEIQKQIAYAKAKKYLAMVSDGKSHSALVKMNFKNRSENWKRNPELSKYYHEWKNSVKEYTTFINKNSPVLRRLQISYKERRISRDRYYKDRQKALSEVRNKFPHEYDSLNKKFQFDLKKLWLKTGEFYLKDCEANGKMFPAEWIEDRYVKSYINSSNYKASKKELDFIETEIIKRI